jgi:hypothetical protein
VSVTESFSKSNLFINQGYHTPLTLPSWIDMLLAELEKLRALN